MSVAPRYRRSGLAADALRRALRQRVIHNQGYTPGKLNQQQQQDVRERTQNRLGNMRENQPGLDTLNPALRRQFLQIRNNMQSAQKKPVQGRQPLQQDKKGGVSIPKNPNQQRSGFVQPPHVKINPNGQLDLPYDPAMADSILDAKDQMNQRLLQMQQEEQSQALEYGQMQRDAGIDYNNLARDTLNRYAGRGMAFSSGYGNQVADNSTQYSNYLNDLSQADTLFKQGMSSERGQIETQFNEMLQRWALQRARDLSKNAGNLGYGKGVAKPVQMPNRGKGGNSRPGANRPRGKRPGSMKKASSNPVGDGFFATQNMGTKKDRADLIELIRSNPEVLALAELGGKKGMRQTKRILNKHGYGFRGKGGTGIAWDKSEQKLLNANKQFLTPRTFVGKKGAGPATLRAKYANWARFKDRDTKERNVFTTAHLAPSIRIPARSKLHKQQVQGLAELQRELAKMFPNASRTVLGDMNTSKAKRLRPLMRKAGLTAYKAPGKTHRVGSIDWILSDAKLRKQLLRDFGSDHRAYFGRM